MNTDQISLKLEAGEKLAGVYLLQSALEIGSGGLVWLAQDEVLGKTVALHFLPASVASDARAIAEIRQEVKRVRPLIHPHILRIYDLVEGEGWVAVATEAFSGKRLSAVLKERGRFEVRDLEDWLDEVCVALEEAHRVKITHRDLDPENLFVNDEGRLLLANFGIGRAVQAALQRAGELGSGSARWSSASPQLLDAGVATPADDVYGVGALFFQLITGDPVFKGGDVFAKIRDAVPPRLSDVRMDADDRGEEIPPGWENVIAACLNKSRDERPSRPAEIVSSIDAYEPIPVASDAGSAAASAAILSSELLEKRSEESAATSETVDEASAAEPVVTAGAAEPFAFKLVEAAPGDSEPENSALPASVAKTPDQEERVEAEEPSVEKDAEPLVAASSAEPVEALKNEPEVVNLTGEKTPAEKHSPLAPTPHFYDTEEDAFSWILPKRFRFPLAVAAAVIAVLAVINGAFKGGKEKPAVTHPIATTDTADRGELTPVKNAGRESAPERVEATPASPDKTSETPAPTATLKAPDRPELLVAAAAPAASGAPANAAPATGSPALSEKAAALERLKAELANTEKAQQARLQEKQAAEAALAEAQKTIDAKTKAAAAAKKEAQELIAARKQREDAQKAADLAAQAAQQLAAEKLRAAEDAKKALAEFETKNQEKLAAPDRAEAELQTLQKTIEDQRKLAEQSAKAAAAAAAAKQQQVAAIQQSEQEIAAAQAMAAKAAEEAERKNAVSSERRKLDDEIAAMRALFEQKMKDIEDRRRQLESGAVPAAPTAPAPAATTAPAAPVPAPPRSAALATPAPTLPLMASRTEPAATPTPAPPATPATPSTGGAGNSLGLRFVPVGDVQFSVWLIRWKDFDTFARAVNLKSTAWRGPGFRQGPDHPVVNVTWNEAVAFCKWLTDKEHKDGSLPASQFYRLPYDLEWSKAVGLGVETGKTPEARDMGVPDVYPWGTDWPPPKGAGNYTGEETGSDVAIKGYDDGFAWTSPVGSFPPNKFGLYDMGGNVWQWCMDSWNADSKARTLRGASWYNGALKLSLLASCRIHATPDSSTDNYGFRIVKATESVAVKPGKK